METKDRRTAQIAPDGAKLREDAERYCARAMQLGATDAKVIRTEDVIIDERARAKCHFPTCSHYNTNLNCSPYTPAVDEVRTLLSRYRYAVLFKIDVASGSLEDFNRASRSVIMNAVWKLESEAFYDGHYLAVGFGGVGCKDIFCPTQECQALTGKGCRHPFIARPNMHAMAIDVFATAARAGWTLYPVGTSCDLATIPSLSSIGILLID